MKYWLKLSALLLIASALVFAFVWHYQEPERKYESIQGGMTPAEVEAVMGRPSDSPAEVDPIMGRPSDWNDNPFRNEEWDDRHDWNFSWFGKKRTVIVMFVRGRAREKILIDISGSQLVIPDGAVRTPILAQEYFDNLKK